jgi:uncharacterized protein (DUF2062 family)
VTLDASATPPSGASAGERRWHARRLLAPLRAQLTQGSSPDRLAFTLGLGTACSLFPFFGFTALLNLIVGLALRLNQPVLQTLNQVLGPLQLLLILPFVRAGELLWPNARAGAFTVAEMLAFFRETSFAEFLVRFGWAGIYAFTAWIIVAPILAGSVTLATRPALRRWAQRGAP